MASLIDRIKRLFKRNADKTGHTGSLNRSAGTRPTKEQQQQKSVPPLDRSEPPEEIQQRTTADTMASGTFTIQLRNDTNSSTVYGYITGLALDSGNRVFLLQADGKTPYYPTNPSSTGSKLEKNCSIPLGSPGNTVTCTIPRLAGGRIWFSVGTPLTFLLNPGPALVEPSIFNPADPNHYTNFGFAEFTYNAAQVFANISYVDFVGLPISLDLTDTANNVQRVAGMTNYGPQTIANGLIAQTRRDGRRWSSLIVNDKAGNLLRILSPNSGITLNPDWFQTYWTDYVNQVYSRYSSNALTVNTQAVWRDVPGTVPANACSTFTFATAGQPNPQPTFPKPSAKDIFSCNSGPFATGSNPETNVIIPRLSAAFNRSTLLLSDVTPNGTNPTQYYQNPTTNHYARIVHAANLDGKGYTFPYDDVTPDGGVGQEGAVFSFEPKSLLVAVGGNGAHV
ncbi:glucanase b [Hortaea werneckii]|nr:glucanase b [Hortaea werneckii]KAI7244607.1 glucanase b [Hortaea werneckii]KAI7305150.1 glucanase b [Hortaea werneckii]KAI7394793.1 glucanase b [Hortaea werneckii]